MRSPNQISLRSHAPQPAPSPLWLAWGLATLVFVITFAAFLPALGNQFLDWDDNTNFTTNPDWRGLGSTQLRWMFSEFHMGHYQPITWLTLGFDFVWGGAMFGDHPVHGPGMDPRSYHLSNIVYHASSAVLVYLVAVRLLACALTGDMRGRSRPVLVAAAMAAMLWSVHPMRVENVAWITERRDLVSSTLLLLSVLAYLRFIQHPRHWKWLAASVIIYIISLMAKVSSAPLPVVLLAIDWYPLRRFAPVSRVSRRSILLEKVPFFVAALVFSYIAAKYQAKHQWMYPFAVHPLDARVVVMFYGLMFYAWKTIAPFNLLPLYGIRIPLDTSQAQFVIAFIVVGITAIGVLALLIMRRLPAVVAAAVCYAAFLGPVLGLFQNGPQLVADRYSYLPSMGLMMLLAGAAAWWVARGPSAVRGRIAIGAGCALVAALAALTWQQCQVWRTSETLWTHQLRLDLDSAVGNFSMGNVMLLDKKQPSEAVPYFRRAVEQDPQAKKYRHNLRLALRQSGQFQELIQAWLEEEALFRSDRLFEYTSAWHRDQGTQMLLADQNELALEHLTVSLALDPNQAEAWNNLAMIYDRLQRPDDAIAAYRQSIQRDPNLPNPRYGLAYLLSRQGQKQNAISELEALLKIKPDDVNAQKLLSQLRRAQ
jgi:Flp pilus assembly protein TadD